jgi:hypothetical protein
MTPWCLLDHTVDTQDISSCVVCAHAKGGRMIYSASGGSDLITQLQGEVDVS